MPALAAFGRERLDGKVAYLATIRENGTPRAHPVTPVIGNGGCFIFVEPASYKLRDLQQNGRYCLHCAMTDSSGSSGEFQIAGKAQEVRDADVRLATESIASYKPSASFLLFELKLNEVLGVAYRGGRAHRTRWVPDA
ncbi:MAG: pyridoxamine 5'-phosphate oxidase family protein [Gammaproteobacteria bacterium]|nr:pyridoxamine 5'-phosphate oxidase family protein [Gammaproteobacteria bacterium]